MDLEAGFEPRTKAQEPILSYEPHGLSRSFLPEVYTCPHPSDFLPARAQRPMEARALSLGANTPILDGGSGVSKEFYPFSSERHFLNKGAGSGWRLGVGRTGDLLGGRSVGAALNVTKKGTQPQFYYQGKQLRIGPLVPCFKGRKQRQPSPLGL